MYKKVYTNITEQAVFENSCDCLRYGYGFSTLNKCGLLDDKAKEIWNNARQVMSEDF